MKVRNAAQVFSQRVTAVMRRFAKDGLQKKEMKSIVFLIIVLLQGIVFQEKQKRLLTLYCLLIAFLTASMDQS
jgi:uncharacterized protein (UPF0548 family)